VGLSHATGNQLRDLGAEIKDEDLLMLHGDSGGWNSKTKRAA
jgi:hypothetical protein